MALLSIPSSPTALNPDRTMLEAYGWKGWNVNPYVIDSSQVLTSGTTRFTLIPFRAGDVVSSLTFICSAAASGVTTIKVGLYDLSGNQLAVSANTTGAMNAAGFSTVSLSAAYTVPSAGTLLGALLVVASGAGNVGCWTSVSGKTSPGGTLGATAAAEAGQTDLDATASLASLSGTGMFWGWA